MGSTEYHRIYVEEPQEIPPQEALGPDGIFAMLSSRLNKVAQSKRWGTAEPQMWMTEMRWGDTWVKWFRKGDLDRGIEPLPRCLVVEGTYLDNIQHLPASWVERMEASPEAVRARYLDGSDEASTGLLYAFSDDQLLEEITVPWGWPVTVAHDYGIDTGAWLWLARVCGDAHLPMRDGDIYVADEMNPAGMVVDEQVAYDTKQRERFRVTQSIIDPHANTRTHAGDRWIRLNDLYAERGLHFQPGSSDKVAGIATIAQLLKDRKLWIGRHCRRLVNDLRTCTLDNEGDKHFHATLRYGLLARPEDQRDLVGEAPRPPGGLVGVISRKIDQMDRKRGGQVWVRGGGR